MFKDVKGVYQIWPDGVLNIPPSLQSFWIAKTQVTQNATTGIWIIISAVTKENKKHARIGFKNL